MTLFSAAHEVFRARVRRFVEERLAPFAIEWEARAECPREVFVDLGREGFLGLTHAKRHGGQELDFGYSVAFAEELPRCHMGGLTLSVLAQSNFFLPLLAAHGTEEQKSLFLAPAIRGEKIGALASTEPTGGSDISHATHSTAESDGDFWIISGEKKYITNAPLADFVVALVRTKPEGGSNGMSLIIIPTDTPGFRARETLRKIGLPTSPTGRFELDRCRVPKRFTLGKPHLGYYYHTHNLHEERLVGGVASLATARLALEDTIHYLQQRSAYGKRLADLQAIRHKIAEMAADLEMATCFVHAVCEKFRDGRVDAKQISMIKFRVVDIVQQTTTQCLQLLGATGFMEENWIGRFYRDMRVLSLGGGASEVMKDLVATYLRL
jgi:alkylation response protein AidB-like acyl-CoA dehydrogenase